MKIFRFILWSLIICVGAPAFAYFVWGGEYFGPAMTIRAEDAKCLEYLRNCPPDEVRLQHYIYGYEAQRVAFSFTTRQFTAEPVMPGYHYGLFWDKMGAVFHSMNFPPLGFKPPNFDDPRLDQIRLALASLPPSPSLDDVPFRDQFHVAYYKDNHLVLGNLFQALGVTDEDLQLRMP